MESPARPGLTRRAFFAALCAPFLARLAKWLPKPAAAPAVDWYESKTVLTHTAGHELRLGEAFTIEGYFSVHPLTRKPTGELKRFVVAAVDAKRREISFVPAAITDGQYQNVHKAA